MAASNQGTVEDKERLAYVPYVAKTLRTYEELFGVRPATLTAMELARKKWWQEVIDDADGRDAYAERAISVFELYEKVFGDYPDPGLTLRLAYEHWGEHGAGQSGTEGPQNPQQSIDGKSIDGIVAEAEEPDNAGLVAAAP